MKLIGLPSVHNGDGIRRCPGPEIQRNRVVCINIFARLNAAATLIAAGGRLPFSGHASPTVIFSYLSGDERLAAQFDRPLVHR